MTVIIETSENEKRAGILKMDTLKNEANNINIGGVIGDILKANEAVWVQTVLKSNPNLFEAFLNPESNNLYKCMWHGEFPGKILSGLAQTYLLYRNPLTKAVGDEMVKLFNKAQGVDGYLGPWEKSVRFNRDVLNCGQVPSYGKWDTWGQYHGIYGLYRWYQITGNQDALKIAANALDCIYDYFIRGRQAFVSQNWAECNLAISHAFALLYEETNKKEYLEAAEYIVNTEWKLSYQDFYTQKTIAADWMTAALDGKRFGESNQTRWESLYSLETLSVLYRVTGKEVYQEAMKSLWWGIVGADRHNTGSFGTSEAANCDPYGDGSETCNTVAWMAFSVDYLKMSKNSYVADELELSFFNAALGSLLANNREFTYMNLSNGKRESAKVSIGEGQCFEGGKDFSCCQANGNRGITQVAEWALLTGKDGLYLNYYGESNMQTVTESGNAVSVMQETEYPRNGLVKIAVSLEREETFIFRLRIPAWSEHTVIMVNGETYNGVRAGEYYEIQRKWNNGDIIELQLDMTLHFWVADQSEKTKRKVSVYYGPLLLAFRSDEEADSIITFEFEELRSMEQTNRNGIVSFQGLSKENQKVEFLDYYSAGKNGDYFVSWIIADCELQPIAFEVEGNPVWNNR